LGAGVQGCKLDVLGHHRTLLQRSKLQIGTLRGANATTCLLHQRLGGAVFGGQISDFLVIHLHIADGLAALKKAAWRMGCRGLGLA